MKHALLVSLAAASVAFAAANADASATVGQAAPAFTLKDTNGKTVNLADYKGKTVVLEWTNEGCPYVKKHYNSGAMQKLQKSAASDGVVWLTVISSAPNTQGYLAPDAAKGWTTRAGDADLIEVTKGRTTTLP